MQAWFLILNLKPGTTWISSKHTDLNCFLHILIMTRDIMTFGMIAMRCLTRFSKKWVAVWTLSVSSAREYSCAFLFVLTLKCDCACRRMCLSSSRIWVHRKQNFVFISSGEMNSLTIVFLITLWCFSVYACLPGPASEGDQHADSSLCLPQQPVDRQRQQQPHHTKPRVVYLHAVCQQVRCRKNNNS